MNKYCVLYNYEQFDLGGYGWKFFEHSSVALSFIEDRIKHNPGAKLADFQLLATINRPLKAVDVVAKIMIGDAT